MQSEIQHDWFGVDISKVLWLCSLYEWDLAPPGGSWAISGLLSHAESFRVLGFVEFTQEPVRGPTFAVKITQRGREFLEKCYPAELLTLLLRRGLYATHAQNAAGKLIRKLPLGVAPMLLVHKNPEVRKIGQTIVERANRV